MITCNHCGHNLEAAFTFERSDEQYYESSYDRVGQTFPRPPLHSFHLITIPLTHYWNYIGKSWEISEFHHRKNNKFWWFLLLSKKPTAISKRIRLLLNLVRVILFSTKSAVLKNISATIHHCFTDLWISDSDEMTKLRTVWWSETTTLKPTIGWFIVFSYGSEIPIQSLVTDTSDDFVTYGSHAVSGIVAVITRVNNVCITFHLLHDDCSSNTPPSYNTPLIDCRNLLKGYY